MSDARLRELERRWKETGVLTDEAAYLLEEDAAGAIDDADAALRLAAPLPGALLVRAAAKLARGAALDGLDDAVEALRTAHATPPRYCRECPAHVPQLLRVHRHITPRGGTLLGAFPVRAVAAQRLGEAPGRLERRLAAASAAPSEAERRAGERSARVQLGLLHDLAADRDAARPHYERVVAAGPVEGSAEYAWAAARLRELDRRR